MLEFCNGHGIVLQAHSPLANGKEWLLQHAVLRRVATESGLTPAQICIQWNVRHGVAVAPKCSSSQHARELLSAAAPHGGRAAVLSAAHMKWLDAIVPPGGQGRRTVAYSVMLKPNSNNGATWPIYGWF